MGEKNDVAGWGTTEDGRHVPITRAQAACILKSIKDAQAKRDAMMPDEASARRVLMQAVERMKSFGWRDGIYCPKDGTAFAVFMFGSTGVFTGHYSGDWPSGCIIAEDEVCDPRGCMWKPIDKLSDEEEAARQKAARATSDFIDRLGRMADATFK